VQPKCLSACRLRGTDPPGLLKRERFRNATGLPGNPRTQDCQPNPSPTARRVRLAECGNPTVRLATRSRGRDAHDQTTDPFVSARQKSSPVCSCELQSFLASFPVVLRMFREPDIGRETSRNDQWMHDPSPDVTGVHPLKGTAGCGRSFIP